MPARSPAEELRRPGRTREAHRGMFTSGIVSTREGRRIALFFTGASTPGRTWDVLAHRAEIWPRRSRCATRCRGTCPAN